MAQGSKESRDAGLLGLAQQPDRGGRVAGGLDTDRDLRRAVQRVVLFFIDVVTALAAPLATFMQARKYIGNWIWWMVLDTTYVALYLERGLYFTAVLYASYLVFGLGRLPLLAQGPAGVSPAHRLSEHPQLGGVKFIRRLSGGGGWNETWLAARDDERLIVRFDTPAVRRLGLDRAAEAGVLRSIHGRGLGPELVFRRSSPGPARDPPVAGPCVRAFRSARF